MNSYRKTLITMCAVSASVFVASVALAKLSAGSGTAKFTASGPGGLRIEGSTEGVTVDDRGAEIVIVVPMSALSTGISLRDKHMKERYLETGKFPKAELHVKRDTIQALSGGATSGNVDGMLQLHGVEKHVATSYVASKSGDEYAVTAKMDIDMREFGIEVPSYLGMSVKPNITVNVAFKTSGN
jgi:polyisoprenoid-binding protein YceI